jgi:hypothetical protein
MTEPSSPALVAICRAGACSACAQFDAVFWSSPRAQLRATRWRAERNAAARKHAFLDCATYARIVDAILAPFT